MSGTIAVGGAKNAATPILAATLLTNETSVIENVPQLEDIFRMINLLEGMSVDVKWLGKNKIEINPSKIDPSKIKDDIVCQMRSSILLWGALAGRRFNFKTPRPGGCVIGARILEPHLEALRQFGVNLSRRGKYFCFDAKSLRGSEITLDESSVTATENAVLAAVLAKGKSTIYCVAQEPYVQDLCHFLNKMGAKISGIGGSILKIDGVDNLHGVKYSLIPDPIEMGTFISLIAASKGSGRILNVVPEFIKLELQKFLNAGINLKFENFNKKSWGYSQGDLVILKVARIKAVAKLHNMPYPGFAADNLPPFAILMTQAEGESLIHDWMYEGRMNYLKELKKMGAHVKILNRHEAIVTGPAKLHGMKISSYDLRAGASLIIAALIAKGQSEIKDVYQIDRGYEKIEERLQQLGAKIKRIN